MIVIDTMCLLAQKKHPIISWIYSNLPLLTLNSNCITFQLSGLNQLGIPIAHTLLEAKVEVATPKFQVARSVFGAMTYSANGP